MNLALSLPRLLFGAGSLSQLTGELVHAALEPDGDAARASLMAAAHAGGIVINKGLDPAHGAAFACSD